MGGGAVILKLLFVFKAGVLFVFRYLFVLFPRSGSGEQVQEVKHNRVQDTDFFRLLPVHEHQQYQYFWQFRECGDK
jgi:hypothetical protein